MEVPSAPESLSVNQVRRDGVINRPDIRRSLARYGAAEGNLRSEMAKQYPNFNIGPGYGGRFLQTQAQVIEKKRAGVRRLHGGLEGSIRGRVII